MLQHILQESQILLRSCRGVPVAMAMTMPVIMAMAMVVAMSVIMVVAMVVVVIFMHKKEPPAVSYMIWQLLYIAYRQKVK